MLFNNFIEILLIYLSFSVFLSVMLSHSAIASFLLLYTVLGKCIELYSQNISEFNCQLCVLLNDILISVICSLFFRYHMVDTRLIRGRRLLSFTAHGYIYDDSCYVSSAVFSPRSCYGIWWLILFDFEILWNIRKKILLTVLCNVNFFSCAISCYFEVHLLIDDFR